MNKRGLLTEIGGIWNFHTIGTGIIITYISSANKLILLNVATGLTIDCIKIEFDSQEDFRDFCKSNYLKMLEDPKPSLDMSYYDKTTYLGDAKVEVDFNIIKN